MGFLRLNCRHGNVMSTLRFENRCGVYLFFNCLEPYT